MNPSILRRRIIGLAGGALWLIAISGAFVIWSLLAIGTPWAKLVLAVTVAVIAAIVVINVVVLRMAMRLPKGINGQKSEKIASPPVCLDCGRRVGRLCGD